MICQYFAPLHVAGLHVALMQQNRLFSSFPLSLAELFLKSSFGFNSRASLNCFSSFRALPLIKDHLGGITF